MKLKSKLLMPALLLGALVATSCGDGTQQLGDSLADGQDVTISFYTNIYTDQEVQLMNNIVSAFAWPIKNDFNLLSESLPVNSSCPFLSRCPTHLISNGKLIEKTSAALFKYNSSVRPSTYNVGFS